MVKRQQRALPPLDFQDGISPLAWAEGATLDIPVASVGARLASPINGRGKPLPYIFLLRIELSPPQPLFGEGNRRQFTSPRSESQGEAIQ